MTVLDEIIAEYKARGKKIEEQIEILDDDLYYVYKATEYFEEKKRTLIQTRLDV